MEGNGRSKHDVTTESRQGLSSASPKSN